MCFAVLTHRLPPTEVLGMLSDEKSVEEQEARIAACTHCAHRTGMSLDSYPPQYPVYCCHCGAAGVSRGMFKQQEGHGPFAPETVVYSGDAIEWQTRDDRDQRRAWEAKRPKPIVDTAHYVL